MEGDQGECKDKGEYGGIRRKMETDNAVGKVNR